MPDILNNEENKTELEETVSGDFDHGRTEEKMPMRSGISRAQKISAGVLVFFGIFVFIFWGAQFKKNLEEPFRRPADGGGRESGSATCQGPDCAENRENVLRAQDTDGDGLSDWDELNVYLTSPYLEDSDSDGFPDKQEAASGNDPNCPTGRTCGTGEDAAGAAGAEAPVADAYGADRSPGAVMGEIPGMADLRENMDAATLRQMLAEAGMDKSVLDRISDEELMKSFRETWQ